MYAYKTQDAVGPADEQHEAQGEDQDWSAAAEAQWMDSVKMFPVSADTNRPGGEVPPQRF